MHQNEQNSTGVPLALYLAKMINYNGQHLGIDTHTHTHRNTLTRRKRKFDTPTLSQFEVCVCLCVGECTGKILYQLAIFFKE